MPLYDILNEFQKGHSHIAVIYKDLNEKKETPKRVQSEPSSKKGKDIQALMNECQRYFCHIIVIGNYVAER